MAEPLFEVALLLALAGCHHESAKITDAQVEPLDMTCTEPAYCCTDDQVGDAGVAPTWRNVELIIDAQCSMGMCHYPGYIADGLDLTHGHAYASLVNKVGPLPADQCGGVLVTPGHPEQSFLMVKLSVPWEPACGLPAPFGASGVPPDMKQCNPTGAEMPIGEPFNCPLPNCNIDMIRRWILAGAPP